MIMDIRFLLASFVLLVHMLGGFAINMQVGNASVKCIERERLSLLALKQGFIDRYGILSSWGNGENQKECCKWLGVGCNNRTGHVVKLDLRFAFLEGTITPTLAELHHLNYLDLRGNKFNLTQFPTFIISLTRLKLLDLSSMNLKGKIPSKLGDLFRLQKLFLSENQLEGGIPKSLALCSLYDLDLSSNFLSGQLDDFVASFSHCANKSLRTLDLSRNRFAGPLPNFSQILSLSYLNLGYNELNGTLNDSIGQLSNLKVLFIAHSSLHGVISETHFLKLSQLVDLDLSFNDLVFKISRDWIPPFQLKSVLLTSCKLGPAFPIWVQTQRSCSDLDISGAEISDTIPNWFWDFSFRTLNLSHNQITGKIPNFPIRDSAYHMDFSSNSFEGSIPSNLSYLQATLDLSNNKFTDASSLLCPNMTTKFSVLDLSNNQLSGLLPDCWIYFESLVFFSVANNSLFGKIPTSMGSLGKIQALHLGNNRFMGEIPMALNKCSELTTFDVVQNNLSGSIPSWIGDGLKKLRILSLRSNMFNGSLPSNICHLSQVQILDLSMNYISGSLPKCINHLSALANKKNFDTTITYGSPVTAYQDRRSNGISFSIADSVSLVWKSKESKYQSILGLVKSIDLSNNMLIGEIPSELMDLVGLVSLNISRNMISGQIPTTIGRLKSLDFLDLSRNYLFGNIPSELSQLDRLSVLDLSYNNLSGEIPLGTQLQSFNASTYEGNVELCGAPLPKCPTKQTEDNQNDSEDNEQFFSQGFYISLSLGFSAGFWGVCSLLFLNKSWRYAYFKLLSNAYDKVYVAVAINAAKLHRRNRVSS